jgi:hypothetical protein
MLFAPFSTLTHYPHRRLRQDVDFRDFLVFDQWSEADCASVFEPNVERFGGCEALPVVATGMSAAALRETLMLAAFGISWSFLIL